MKNSKKIVIMTLVLTLTVPMASFYGTDINVEAASDNTLQNPRRSSDGKVVWDCVWFGNYPQAEIIPSGEYEALPDSTMVKEGDTIVSDILYEKLQSVEGWDALGDIVIDGNKYRRIKSSDATVAKSKYSAHYNWTDSTTYHYFQYQPIKWRVLNVDGDNAFLMAEKGLDTQKYNAEYTEVTWETSTIRSWLNGYDALSNTYGTDYSSKNFIDTAFFAEEQSAIRTTTVIAYDTLQEGTESGNNTKDKIFLPSITDVTTESHGFEFKYWISKDGARNCEGSTYAKAMGAYTVSTFNDFWLRTAGASLKRAAVVNWDGYVGKVGNTVGRNDCAVRPALYLNLQSSDVYTYAGTVCNGDDAKEQESDGNIQSGDETENKTQEQQTNVKDSAVTETTITPKNKANVKAPSRAKIKKLKKGKKKAVLTIKKVKGAKGYVIQYSRKKSFKKAKKKYTAKTKLTIKKLKSGKRYYFRVKAYKLDGKKRVMSKKWSKIKRVKVK